MFTLPIPVLIFLDTALIEELLAAIFTGMLIPASLDLIVVAIDLISEFLTEGDTSTDIEFNCLLILETTFLMLLGPRKLISAVRLNAI
jgi:hypothetical protein